MAMQLPSLSTDSLLPYLSVAVGIAATLIVALIVRRVLNRLLPKYMPASVYKPLNNLIFYVILFFGIISSLAPLNIDLSGLLVAGGVFGVAVAFASRTVFSNFLSGLFMYIDRPLKVGDAVKVEGVVEGVVKEIGVFSTRIMSWDGHLVRIPNEKLFSSPITNYSAQPVRRISILVGISYHSDLDKAREALLNLAERHPFVLVEPAPEVLVQDHGDSAVILNFRCWAPTPQWWPTRVWLMERVKRALEEAGVEIPFPQRVVWLKEDGKS